jgi:hypothetical protein
LEAANKQSDWFGVREINIVDWKTPVVKQYEIRSIPHCVVYDQDGRLKESSSRACWLVAQGPEQIRN